MPRPLAKPNGGTGEIALPALAADPNDLDVPAFVRKRLAGR